MRAMRRNEFEMTAAEAASILRRAEYGVLSTISADNTPYGVPMNYVFEDGEILLHCALDGHKIDNMRNNERVCFTVVGKAILIPERSVTAYESVIVFGKASIISSDDEKREILAKFIRRFIPAGLSEAAMNDVEADVSKHGVVRIVVDSISGKARE